MRNRNFSNWNDPAYLERRKKNRFFFGIIIALFGIFILLKKFGWLTMYGFTFSWPIILIAIGILIGFKNGFRRNVWWVLILIGVLNEIPYFKVFGVDSDELVWPLLIVTGGLVMAFRPRKWDRCNTNHPYFAQMTTTSTEGIGGRVDIDVAFGGKKEMITAKDFKGGLVTVAFGGCELNLTQADLADNTAVMDFRVSFGGVELIVPSHWEIQNEIVPSFGSVEDSRSIQTNTNFENKKTLILKGSCAFGNIEIKSY